MFPISDRAKSCILTQKMTIPVIFTQEPWNLSINEELTRPELTKFVFDYIKQNNLRDPTTKGVIIHDDKLGFYNFQKYLSKAYKMKLKAWNFLEHTNYKKEDNEMAFKYLLLGYQISGNEAFRTVFLNNIISYLVGITYFE
tara:strand:- start:267 stop:689 length:423 start_codon:yes stop_codon:yes gene_type:complete